MMMKKSNILVVDEPTNHLDLESITAFNNSLKNFDGTVLLSTHDNTFAQTVGDRVIELTPKGAIDRLLRGDDYMKDLSLKKLEQNSIINSTRKKHKERLLSSKL